MSTAATTPTFTSVLYEKKDAIAYVTLNRPKVLNALNKTIVAELKAAFEDARDDSTVRGIVLTGAGEKAFAAGADISEVLNDSPLEAEEKTRFGQALTSLIENLGKPVIAAVNGYAVGGGCELAMACTIRLASETAKFGQPEVKLGIMPGYGGTQRLPRLVGKGRALQLILTGETIDAREAHRIGLVNKVVPAAELLTEAERMVRGVVGMGPLAVRLALEAVDRGLEMTLDEGLLLEANHFGLLAATRDMKEGLTAFLEKRAPKFEGR